VTLETAYDDSTVVEVANVVGKQKGPAYFTKLAHNYQNVWNPVTQFMSPKSSDGNWVGHFDPKLGGGQEEKDYTTEVDSWLYTFSVQHDAEVSSAHGRPQRLQRSQDQLFVERYGTSKFHFLGQFPDVTGLVVLYSQGNEPSFHIPYLYDFSGKQRDGDLLDLGLWVGNLGYEDVARGVNAPFGICI
jgi:putative alpha-1,2-mannosidase